MGNCMHACIKTGDKRTNWYRRVFGVNYGVEIDALPPSILRQKIQEAIEQHLDLEELEQKKAEDREEINDVIRRLNEQM